ncbi:MAG: helix-turn-helix domain-containing protein, partial [Sciscionella sp.]
GYSASQISRWETGRLPLRDVAVLRALAKVLHLPPEVFGLTAPDAADRHSPTTAGSGHKVSRVTTPQTEENDPVRRRAFLQLAGMAGTSMALPGTATAGAAIPAEVDPAAQLASRLGDVLLGPVPPAEPASLSVLREALAAARQEFTACQYIPLATRLPTLLSTADATAGGIQDPQVQGTLAASYNLATRALIKLEASGLEWLSADRGLRTARGADNSLTLVESQRLVASVTRRAGQHDRAQALTLAAADYLDVHSPRPAPEHLAMYGMLHCSAGYAAARAGDRDRANDLLTEAEATTARLTDDPDRHRALTANVVSHRVSVAYVSGDAGTALAHCRSLPLAAIPTTERRARLLVDAAQAWAQWGKPDRAYATLLAAERTAPGEVHTRNAVRRLVGDLMASPRQTAMPGLPALAHRVHVAA